MGKKHVVLIGAGIGGCSMAALLAHSQQYHVTILEAQSTIGGLCNLEYNQQYRFDTGPSIVLMLHVFRDFFTKLGEDLHQHVQVLKCSPSVLYIDDVVLHNTNDPSIIDNEMHWHKRNINTTNINTTNITNATIEDKIKQYHRLRHHHYRLTMTYILERLFRWSHLLNITMYIKLIQLGVLTTQTQMLKRYFTSPVVRQALSYHCMFMGDPPDKSPSTFALLDHSIAQGMFYFKGGLQTICQALINIAQKHSSVNNTMEIRLGSVVTGFDATGRSIDKIHYTHEGHACTLEGFDTVIINASLPSMTLMLPRYRLDVFHRWRIKQLKLTSSTVTFYWGVNHPLPTFKSHMFFSSGDFEANMSATLHERLSNPTLYIHTASLVDPDAAPDGRHSVAVLIPVPPLSDVIDDEWLPQHNREHFINALRTQTLNIIKTKTGIDISNCIECEHISTPVDWQNRYRTYRGAPLGIGHGMTQLAMFRPSPKHHWFTNLYFVGSSTQPGTGLPMVMRGAELIFKEYF